MTVLIDALIDRKLSSKYNKLVGLPVPCTCPPPEGIGIGLIRLKMSGQHFAGKGQTKC